MEVVSPLSLGVLSDNAALSSSGLASVKLNLSWWAAETLQTIPHHVLDAHKGAHVRKNEIKIATENVDLNALC